MQPQSIGWPGLPYPLFSCLFQHFTAILFTPIKCLDLDDISAKLNLEGWLYNALFFYTLLNEEAPFYNQFWWGGNILLVILERRPHFIGYFREEEPFYWVNLGGGWLSFFIYVQNCAGGWLEFLFYGPCSTWRAGHLDQVILLVWPKALCQINFVHTLEE